MNTLKGLILPDRSPNRNPMATLEGMPREIREEIYKYCLHHEYCTKFLSYEGERKPFPELTANYASGLFRTNKMIGTEALDYFYISNSFADVTVDYRAFIPSSIRNRIWSIPEGSYQFLPSLALYCLMTPALEMSSVVSNPGKFQLAVKIGPPGRGNVRDRRLVIPSKQLHMLIGLIFAYEVIDQDTHMEVQDLQVTLHFQTENEQCCIRPHLKTQLFALARQLLIKYHEAVPFQYNLNADEALEITSVLEHSPSHEPDLDAAVTDVLELMSRADRAYQARNLASSYAIWHWAWWNLNVCILPLQKDMASTDPRIIRAQGKFRRGLTRLFLSRDDLKNAVQCYYQTMGEAAIPADPVDRADEVALRVEVAEASIAWQHKQDGFRNHKPAMTILKSALKLAPDDTKLKFKYEQVSNLH